MRKLVSEMIDAILKDLDQNSTVIKVAPPARRSRAFALWLALLVLYVLLLPTAAETPDSGHAGLSTHDGGASGFIAGHHWDASDAHH